MPSHPSLGLSVFFLSGLARTGTNTGERILQPVPRTTLGTGLARTGTNTGTPDKEKTNSSKCSKFRQCTSELHTLKERRKTQTHSLTSQGTFCEMPRQGGRKVWWRGATAVPTPVPARNAGLGRKLEKREGRNFGNVRTCTCT